MHAGRAKSAGLAWWKLAHRKPHRAEAWAGLIVCALAAHKPWLAMRVRPILEERTEPHQARQLLADAWRHMIGGTVLAKIEAGEVEDHTRDDAQSPIKQLLDKAVQTLTQHVGDHTDRADAIYHLANCFAENDAQHEAAEIVQFALEINPNYRD